MSRPFPLRRTRNGNSHMATTPSPLRHASNASSLSEDSICGNENVSPIAIKVAAIAGIDIARRRVPSGQKRSIRDTSPAKSSPSTDYHYSEDENVSSHSKNRRPSLKELAQPHIMSSSPNEINMKQSSSSVDPEESENHNSPTTDGSSILASSGNLPSRKDYSMALSRSDSRRAPYHPHHHHYSSSIEHSDAQTSPPANILDSSELEELGKSSTGYFKTLSKFAKQNDNANFTISTPDKGIGGLSGRRRLQRNMSARAKKNSFAPGYGGRIWMDNQRQFLQAYEYLCHIGEAKEWIEDVIHKPIPPIVQLEETLRDGVTLAEIVQAMRPDKPLRIFHHPKLQFRHSDNIAHFFRFLADIELPELFRFELVDLYEKKNIPKVIYCIHALSWLLYRKGMVDFRIGNLVGQLEFAHDELEATQKGLDKAGVSMPNFSGVQENFVEPDPEPEETEEERQDRELADYEDTIVDFQSQLRGVLLRLQLSDTMQDLWEHEDYLVDLQSRIRGDMVRQVVAYRLQMKEFAEGLQSIIRGYLVRSRKQEKEEHWKIRENEIIKVQSLVRARAARNEAQRLRSEMKTHHHGIRELQAAIRGALCRWDVGDQYAAVLDCEPLVTKLQALIRGSRARHGHKEVGDSVQSLESNYISLQSRIRAALSRSRTKDIQDRLRAETSRIIELQAALRGAKARNDVSDLLSDLSDEETTFLKLQSLVRAHYVRKTTGADLKYLIEQHDQICRLQSGIRGANVRRSVYNLLCDVNEHEESIIGLQALVRAMLIRNDVMDTLDALDDAEDNVIELQAALRGMIVRKQFAEKQRHYNEQIQKVIKVQSYVRGRQQGKQYESLTKGKNPPVSTVKNFVHLLNDNNFDFDAELESEKLQKTLLQRIKDIDQVEQYITEVDAKIGLLAHTKIASDEVTKFKKQHGAHAGTMLSRDSSVRESFNLKALNKNSRAKLELYQELFFLLQTQPQYLARLFKRIRQHGSSDIDPKLESLVINTFGFVQKRREEYYFLRLMSRSMKEEAETCESVQQFVRGSFFFTRLFGMYTRVPRDRKYLRQLFGPLIKQQIMDNAELDLESDPLQIYRAAISDEELRTGQRSRRNPDLPREEAIKDAQTREAFVHHLQDLRDVVDLFIISLEEALQRLPYGTRYIAQQMFEILHAQFPDEPAESLVEIVGNWVWKNYLRPALAEPEATGVVDRGLDPTHKRNLHEVNKVVTQIVKGQPFGNENVYLQPLNSYVNESISRTSDIWHQMINAQSIDEHFDISEFNDLYAKVRPTLYIKMADVFSMHRMIASEQGHLCHAQDDNALREVIRDLGNPKVNELEMSTGTAEVALQLSSKIHNLEDPDAEIKARFMEAKRCILYIIRIQSGASLWDIMVEPVTEEDEDRWALLVDEELATNGQKLRAYSDYTSNTNQNLIDIASMSYGQLKAVALENIVYLEEVGRLRRDNQFQDILNEIAVDIRNKHRRRLQRQRELDTVRSTISHLEEKKVWLEDKLKAYNDTFEQGLTALQTKKAKKRFIMPFSKQYNHERELARLGRVPKFGSWKYSAENLAAKGIVISWNGFDLRSTDITISSDEVNEFIIEGSKGSMILPGCSVQFKWDDLLDAQYAGTESIEFFADGPDVSDARRAGRRGLKNEGVLRLDRRAFMQWLSKKFWPE